MLATSETKLKWKMNVSLGMSVEGCQIKRNATDNTKRKKRLNYNM